MSDDDVDHDLLEFMRAHMTGKSQEATVTSSLGVLESAERIYDVSYLWPLTKSAGSPLVCPGRLNKP